MTSRVPVSPSLAVAVQGVTAGAGTLSVTTDPVGAQVYLDDVLRGASPAIIPNLAAGSHILRLEREGYRTMRVPVTISDGKTTEYSTALIPESGGKSAPPLGAAAAVIASAGAGAYLYIRKKKAP
jgi:non-ribosomal peptide synthetase component F